MSDAYTYRTGLSPINPLAIALVGEDAQGCEWARIQEALRPIGTWLLESTME